MSSLYSFKDIQEATGLKMDFLRKVFNANEDLFKPYITRGTNNSVLFNSSGYTLFDKIKQKKESGANIPEISAYLRQISGQSTSPTGQSPQNQVAKPPEETFAERLLEKVEGVYERALKAKDETIDAQKQQISDLRNSLLLLTDGKTPEETKRQQEERAAALKDKADQTALDLEQERKAKAQAESKLNDVQQALSDSQAREKQAKAWAQWEGKRAELLQEFQSLPWFPSKRKGEIKKALAELEKEKPEILS